MAVPAYPLLVADSSVEEVEAYPLAQESGWDDVYVYWWAEA